jgi:hypothetical protein
MQECQECLQRVLDTYLWDAVDKAPTEQASAFEAACIKLADDAETGFACRQMAFSIAADSPINLGKRAALYVLGDCLSLVYGPG